MLWLEPQTSTLFRLFFQVSLSALWLPMPSLSTLKLMPRQSLCPDLYPVGHSDVFTEVSRNHPQSHSTELPSHFLRVTSISHHYDKVSARSNRQKNTFGGLPDSGYMVCLNGGKHVKVVQSMVTRDCSSCFLLLSKPGSRELQVASEAHMTIKACPLHPTSIS